MKIIPIKSFLDLCKKAHEGQTDKAGKPYYLHPFAVANNVMDILNNNEKFYKLTKEDKIFLRNRATIVAFCHDLFEDTNTTEKELVDVGADRYVLDALDFLTKEKDDSYDEYIEKLCINGIAMAVKLADLTHNMDIRRFVGVKQLDDADMKRLNRYLMAYEKVEREFNQWLDNYLLEKIK